MLTKLQTKHSFNYYNDPVFKGSDSQILFKFSKNYKILPVAEKQNFIVLVVAMVA